MKAKSTGIVEGETKSGYDAKTVERRHERKEKLLGKYNLLLYLTSFPLLRRYIKKEKSTLMKLYE